MRTLALGLFCGLALFIANSTQDATAQIPIDLGPPRSTVERQCNQTACTLDAGGVVQRFRCGATEEDLHCTNSLGPNCAWVCSDY